MFQEEQVFLLERLTFVPSVNLRISRYHIRRQIIEIHFIQNLSFL